MERGVVGGGGLLSVTEAARFLGWSRSRVYALMQRGKLEFVTIGGVRRIPERALIELRRKHLPTGGGSLAPVKNSISEQPSGMPAAPVGSPNPGVNERDETERAANTLVELLAFLRGLVGRRSDTAA